MIETFPCSKCGYDKPLVEYHPSIILNNDTKKTCKLCMADYRERKRKAKQLEAKGNG